jgi:hypothetical protein
VAGPTRRAKATPETGRRSTLFRMLGADPRESPFRGPPLEAHPGSSPGHPSRVPRRGALPGCPLRGALPGCEDATKRDEGATKCKTKTTKRGPVRPARLPDSSQKKGKKRRAPCLSTGRPALPLLPEGSAQRTVRKGDPPAGDQTLYPCGRRGERPGVLVAGGSHGWRSEQSCGGLRLYCYHSSGPPERSQAARRLKKVLQPSRSSVAVHLGA